MQISSFKLLLFGLITVIVLAFFVVYSAVLTKQIIDFDKTEIESVRYKISE